MITAKKAHNIALQVRREPVESKILTAVNQGEFCEYFPSSELHSEVINWLKSLGYVVKASNLSGGYVVSWYKQ